MKDKRHLTNLISSYDEMEEQAMDIIDFDFSTTFKIIFHNIFTLMLRKYNMNIALR